MEEFLDKIKIETLERKKDFARFGIGPLERGFGHTLGNSLRRVLLESLPGAAITSVKISGVFHQFATLSGVKEDVVEIVLNLKKVRLKLADEESAKLSLSVKKAGQVKAGDIKAPAGVKIVNPDLHIASLSGKKVKLEMEIVVQRGRGYLMAEDQETSKVGEILMDAVFSPVVNVGLRVEPTRVGRRTDFDKLVLEITTDGSTTPLEALKQAAQITVAYFEIFYKPRPKEDTKKEKTKIPKSVAGVLVEELDLPVRVVNTLRKAKLGTVGDLAKATRADLLKVRNLGEKSVKLVEAKLKDREIILAAS